MSNDVIRFPINGTKRVKNRRGKYSVSCYVSGRWLRFKKEPGLVERNSRAVAVDVMTDGDYEDLGPLRKFAKLVLELDDLRAVLALYDEKVAAN